MTETPSALAIDPVCGMTVDPRTAAAHVRYRDSDYYFCAKRCAERFQATPETFLAPKVMQLTHPSSAHAIDGPPHAHVSTRPVVKPAATDARMYVCPMHPEVRQKG